jgi:hypothetical protein
MALIRINENDFLDIGSVDHFFMENNELICITSAERIEIPNEARREVLTALFRNDMSKQTSRQVTQL